MAYGFGLANIFFKPKKREAGGKGNVFNLLPRKKTEIE